MRILVVEDEEKVSRFVVRGLTAERFAVDAAGDGKSGWELAQTYQYDLIILDLMLPQMAGGEVLRKIRRANSQVPVLVLTAKDSLGDKVEHFEAGADDYLTKPFAFAELLVRVKALLRRGPVARASVLRIGARLGSEFRWSYQHRGCIRPAPAFQSR
jgi:DNA-binding response OmpR family regulator